MVKIKAKWLRLSEETNSLDYLIQAYYYIKSTEREIIAWKWVLLCLHTALYGFAICAVRGTSDDSVTFKTKKGEKKLISFDEALKRCQDPRWMQMTETSKHLQLTTSQRESIQEMKHVFRNKFEHYVPTSWSIEIHGFPILVIDVLEVIRFLALETGNYVHLDSSQEKKIKSIIFQSKKLLQRSKLYKEAKIASSRFAT
jgi:hypothetical protein